MKLNDYFEEDDITQYDISVIPNDFNVLTIFELIRSGRISLPVFQRNYVWDKKKASRFIESLILGLPIPQVFLYQKERNEFSIIDGQQRLLTIYYFIKQRFPKDDKRVQLRRIFDNEGNIPDEILNNDEYFSDFRLTFIKQENGMEHPLSGLKFTTLGKYKSDFEYMPMRCMAIRQNEPQDDDRSIFEIFNRLNTGGVNLNPQEIRACLYYSPFYGMLYKLNQNPKWRSMYGRNEEDSGMKDIEILLRSFALLCESEVYKGVMTSFLNSFSKRAMAFTIDKIDYLENLFISFTESCDNLRKDAFRSENGSFNIALFDCVFATIAKIPYKDGKYIVSYINQEALDALREDAEFKEAAKHSASHSRSVKIRMDRARSILL